MICCVSRAKMHFEHRKIEFSFNFGLFFSIFSFSQFWVVLAWFHYEFRFPGRISCPGMLPDQPRAEFSLKMAIFLAHYKNNQKIATLGLQRIYHSAFVQSSRFACAHHFTQTFRENYQTAKRTYRILTQ